VLITTSQPYLTTVLPGDCQEVLVHLDRRTTGDGPGDLELTYDHAVRTLLRPSSQASHLKQIVNLLNKGPGRERSALAPIFHDLAERITRRGNNKAKIPAGLRRPKG